MTLIKGFPYYGCMNVTLTLDDQLVKKCRKIAVDRDTTLTGLVRSYLRQLAEEDDSEERKRQALERLERSFKEISYRVGKRTWTRADLYERR